MTFEEMHAACRDAREKLSSADMIADKLAELLVGRLRRAGGYYCAVLKAELRRFNAHTKKWSDK